MCPSVREKETPAPGKCCGFPQGTAARHPALPRTAPKRCCSSRGAAGAGGARSARCASSRCASSRLRPRPGSTGGAGAGCVGLRRASALPACGLMRGALGAEPTDPTGTASLAASAVPVNIAVQPGASGNRRASPRPSCLVQLLLQEVFL